MDAKGAKDTLGRHHGVLRVPGGLLLPLGRRTDGQTSSPLRVSRVLCGQWPPVQNSEALGMMIP